MPRHDQTDREADHQPNYGAEQGDPQFLQVFPEGHFGAFKQVVVGILRHRGQPFRIIDAGREGGSRRRIVAATLPIAKAGIAGEMPLDIARRRKEVGIILAARAANNRRASSRT